VSGHRSFEHSFVAETGKEKLVFAGAATESAAGQGVTAVQRLVNKWHAICCIWLGAESGCQIGNG